MILLDLPEPKQSFIVLTIAESGGTDGFRDGLDVDSPSAVKSGSKCSKRIINFQKENLQHAAMVRLQPNPRIKNPYR